MALRVVLLNTRKFINISSYRRQGSFNIHRKRLRFLATKFLLSVKKIYPQFHVLFSR